MENYTKGKNVEEPIDKEKIPISNLPSNFLWMRVNPGTKIRNVLSYALKSFKDEKLIVWTGSGPAVEKTITCVEIMKRRCKSLHQITKICYRKVEEYWEPKLEGLDQLVVVREIPVIHIFLSKDIIDKNEPGYQAPGCAGWRPEGDSSEKSAGNRRHTRGNNGEQRTQKRKKLDFTKQSKSSVEKQ